MREDNFTFYRFQSTLPRGERRYYYLYKSSHVHFNPRSHEGSDVQKIMDNLWERISIHAPTRGATTLPKVIREKGVFQSTLPRGERPASLQEDWGSSNFNPRSHEGSDENWLDILGELKIISIHAPTRGATPHRSTIPL